MRLSKKKKKKKTGAEYSFSGAHLEVDGNSGPRLLEGLQGVYPPNDWPLVISGAPAKELPILLHELKGLCVPSIFLPNNQTVTSFCKPLVFEKKKKNLKHYKPCSKMGKKKQHKLLL